MAVKLFSSRNLRYGFVSVCITVVVIAVIVLLNVVLTALFEKYPLNIDLTQERIFEISTETKEFLADLDRDVSVYVLNTESRFAAGNPTEYFIQANEVIRKYAQYSSRITIEYVDLLRNPDFPARFPGVYPQVNDILLVSGGRSKVITPQDLFNIQSSNYGNFVASSKAEQAMSSALLTVVSDRLTIATVIGGHGETDVTAFTDLLQMNAWGLNFCNTMTEPIPPSTDLLILAAPTWDLLPEELQKIDDFLESGGNRIFFYLSSLTQPIQDPGDLPNQPSLQNLDAFLAEWGLAVDPGIVFEDDPNRRLGESPYVFLADFAEEDFALSVLRNGLYPVLPQSRPLRLIFDQERYRSTQVLIGSSYSSGIRPADASLDWLPSDRDRQAYIPLLAMGRSSRPNVEGDVISSYVLACGSVMAWNQGVLGNLSFANSTYFLDLLGRISGRENQIYIQDKTLGFANLNITAAQMNILGVIFIALIPLAVLGTGIVVWLRRRHK